MSEADAIDMTDLPVTIQSLKADLTDLGLQSGMVLLVHSSLSSIGWMCGGPVAVILAFEEVVEPQGTLIMPAHSGDLSDPGEWENPPVPESWWTTIRETMPAYDPDLTPTRGMGAIPESFRKQKGVLRSSHPQHSFCAWGTHAARIVDHQPLAFGMGEGSPLAKIYDLDGWILLLGVGHSSNTSLHLAEHRASFANKKVVQQGAPIRVNGVRRWATFEDMDWDASDFDRIGEAGTGSVMFHS